MIVVRPFGSQEIWTRIKIQCSIRIYSVNFLSAHKVLTCRNSAVFVHVSLLLSISKCVPQTLRIKECAHELGILYYGTELSASTWRARLFQPLETNSLFCELWKMDSCCYTDRLVFCSFTIFRFLLNFTCSIRIFFWKEPFSSSVAWTHHTQKVQFISI